MCLLNRHVTLSKVGSSSEGADSWDDWYASLPEDMDAAAFLDAICINPMRDLLAEYVEYFHELGFDESGHPLYLGPPRPEDPRDSEHTPPSV